MIGAVSRTRAVVTALSVIPVLLVAGCTDDDPKPKLEPPPETQSSRVPEGNDPRSEQAAFVTAYFGTISDALSTGDPAPFLAMSSSSCVNCQTLADNVLTAYADGGHVEGGSWTARTPTFEQSDSLGDVWNVDVQTSRERWIGSDGQLVKTVRPSLQHFGVALEPAGQGWKVSELRVSS
jgi:hypothetical protein